MAFANMKSLGRKFRGHSGKVLLAGFSVSQAELR